MLNFNRLNFFPLKNKLSSSEIPKLIQDYVIDYEITDIFDIIDNQKNKMKLLVNNKKILITGSNGLLGQKLIDLYLK